MGRRNILKGVTGLSFALSVKGLCYSWAAVMSEAEKCDILCKNCHTEVENGKAKL